MHTCSFPCYTFQLVTSTHYYFICYKTDKWLGRINAHVNVISSYCSVQANNRSFFTYLHSETTASILPNVKWTFDKKINHKVKFLIHNCLCFYSFISKMVFFFYYWYLFIKSNYLHKFHSKEFFVLHLHKKTTEDQFVKNLTGTYRSFWGEVEE